MFFVTWKYINIIKNQKRKAHWRNVCMGSTRGLPDSGYSDRFPIIIQFKAIDLIIIS